MTREVHATPVGTADGHAASEYIGLMPTLERYASLPPEHPDRPRLREELALGFLPVVRHVAARHARGYPGGLDDLVQVGALGLLSALDRWDPELARGEFLGYLVPCVRGEILRYFRDRTWTMRVPRRLKDLTVAIRQVTGPLSQQLGRAPRPSELAAHLDVPVEEVIEALDAESNQYTGSLDAVLGEDDGDNPITNRLGELDAALDLVEYRHALRPLLDRLPERERTILLLRFFGELTQTQIAERIGISQMHVSRLLSRTLRRLRSELLDGPGRPPGRRRAREGGRLTGRPTAAGPAAGPKTTLVTPC
ncbi:RNA polymerase sigma factor SigF [Pseudonocardia yuanmonensis]|uniref:RNA polymerase sigma factor SigF n=1 Tax=Pseudonocardia yuanmonensis TaxID=1095914 RepID=A0ABP8WP61_9PSEU